MVLEPEDGPQDEDPEGNMQPSNNVVNGAQNNGQQPNNDLDIPLDADLLPDNVDHWVRHSTRIRRKVSRFDPSLHYIMRTS